MLQNYEINYDTIRSLISYKCSIGLSHSDINELRVVWQSTLSIFVFTSPINKIFYDNVTIILRYCQSYIDLRRASNVQNILRLSYNKLTIKLFENLRINNQLSEDNQ